MATDNTNIPQAGNNDGTQHDAGLEVIQLADNSPSNDGQGNQGQGNPAQAPGQAAIAGVPNGEVHVAANAGETVIRVQVAPGETIDLPFDGELAAKFGQQGNLAIKHGDLTIILQGYAQANQEAGVTIKDDKGHPIDIASTIAQTDPNLDIQTAAGPAAGPAGAQGGHLFFGFAGGNGLGGFGELGVINPTELQYHLIQPDETILVRAPEVPVVPPTSGVEIEVRLGEEGGAISYLKEDVPGNMLLTATPGEAADTITNITVSNIPSNVLVDGNAADIFLSNGTVGSVTLVNGVLSIDVVGATAGVPVVATVHIIGQQDSDVDGTGLVLTVTATNGTSTQTSAPNVFDVPIDAVLDQYIDVSGAADKGTESQSSQTIVLGLHAALADAGFQFSGFGGPDTDGSEVRSVTLTLNAALPAGASMSLSDPSLGTITSNDGIHYTLTPAAGHTFDELAQAVQVTLPANFIGTITGTIDSDSHEVTSGAEPDLSDNSRTDSATWSLDIAAHVSPPRVGIAVEGSHYFKEDVQNVADFSATPTEPTDHISQIVVTGLTGWTVGSITLSNGTIGSEIFDAVTGTLTINVTGATDGATVTAQVQLTPPEDTDVDSPISVTGTAEDHGLTATTTTQGTLVVDAVLDQYIDVSGAADTGTNSASPQTIVLGLHAALATAGFANSMAGGADTDGSEVRSVTLTLDSPLPAGATLSVNGGATIGTLTPIDATHYTLVPAAGHTYDDLASAIQVTLPANFVGSITGTISSDSHEVTTDSEPDTSDNVQDDSATWSVTIGAHVSPPTTGVVVEGAHYFKEDVQNTVDFTATPQEPTDHITQIVVTGLTGWTIGSITLSNGTAGFETFNAVTGTLTINVIGAADGATVTAQVQLTPPEDTDHDSPINVSATAEDHGLTASSVSTSSTLVVDAVLDQYLDVSGATENLAQSSSAQTTTLGLHAILSSAGFANSMAGGADTDGSEVRSVTLVLNSALPVGASLSVTGGASVGTITMIDATHYALTPAAGHTFDDVAAAVQLTLPAYYSGTVSGTIVSDSHEVTSDSEPDLTDNSKGDTASWSVVVPFDSASGTLHNGSVTVAEDSEPGQNTGDLTIVKGHVDLTGIFTPADNETVNSITITNIPVGVMIFVNGVATTGTGSNSVTIQAPDFGNVYIQQPNDNKDNDYTLSYTANVTDPDSNDTKDLTGGLINVTVDAVADQPTNVTLTVHDSNNNGFINGEAGTLNVTATFGDYQDGSETHTVAIQLATGFTATGLAASGTLADGVAYTYNSASGQILLTVPNGTSSINETINIQAPASGSLPSTLTFVATATATETTTSGGEPDLTNNTSSVVVSTGIPSSHILNGDFVTNTNVKDQQLLISFIDSKSPLDAFAQIYSLDLQGQQGSILTDAGFDINHADKFYVGIESIVDPKVIITDFSLEGVSIVNQGNAQIELDNNATGANNATAITAEMTPDNGGSVPFHYAQDGTQTGNTLTNTTHTTSYLYGADGNDTLNGDTTTAAHLDILNGGSGTDTLNGGGGTNLYVYGAGDHINGSAGHNVDGSPTVWDILRIDDGAVAITKEQQQGLTDTQQTVSIHNQDIHNIDAILITEEAKPDSSIGTTVVLQASDVLNYTDSAHTMYIIGSAGDKVDLSADAKGTWTDTGTQVLSSSGQAFEVWHATINNVQVTLNVDHDLNVVTK